TEGQVGAVRRDPMATLPCPGYNVGEYFQHWVDMGARGADKMPNIFLANRFRKADDGRFVWPGVRENSGAPKWILGRRQGRVGGVEGAARITARAEDIDMTGLDTPIEDVQASLAIEPEEWRRELPLIAEWLEFCGPQVPAEVHDEFAALKARLD